jgi:hypothetical protein
MQAALHGHTAKKAINGPNNRQKSVILCKPGIDNDLSA